MPDSGLKDRLGREDEQYPEGPYENPKRLIFMPTCPVVVEKGL